jgi:hypothetical protein
MFDTFSKFQLISRISSPFKGQPKEEVKSYASQPKSQVDSVVESNA